MSNMSQNNSNIPRAASQDTLLLGLMITTEILIYYSIVVHLIYFVLVALVKELRKKPLIYIHNAVLVSILYPLGILVFQYVNPAAINNRNFVTVLCSAFEYFWPVSVYMRMYSILLIAIHRYLAVFHLEVFKRVNNSVWIQLAPIAITWLVSFALTAINKYSLNTTYTITFCLDGFSPIWLNNLIYAVVFVTLSMIIPALMIFIIYFIISHKLRVLGLNLGGSVSNKTTSRPINQRREQRFANQFVAMCIAVILNICGIATFSIRSLVPNYFVLFFYWRFVIRSFVLIMISLIPIISVVFNSSIKNPLAFLKSRTMVTQASNTAT